MSGLLRMTTTIRGCPAGLLAAMLGTLLANPGFTGASQSTDGGAEPASAPPLAPGSVGKPALNQHFIEVRRAEIAAAHEDRQPQFESIDTFPDFDDPLSILRFILSGIDTAIVYPTEQYFYYRFVLGDRQVSGNIRFTDASTQVLHIGYFDSFRPAEVRYATFNSDSGVHIIDLQSASDDDIAIIADHHAQPPMTAEAALSDPDWDELPGRQCFLVIAGDQSCRFCLAHEYRNAGAANAYDQNEVLISGILDESAHALVLVYDQIARGFRYIMAAEYEPPETLLQFSPTLPHLFVGEESGFVFLQTCEPEPRMTLVGVLADNIRRNNYFDGPFDQVPPDLDLRPYLHLAYPYTRRDHPVDQHGNFVGREGHRVAIAPYVPYESLEDIEFLYLNLLSRGHSFEQIVWLMTREPQQSIFTMPRRQAMPTRIPHPGRPVTLHRIISDRLHQIPEPSLIDED